MNLDLKDAEKLMRRAAVLLAAAGNPNLANRAGALAREAELASNR